MFRRGAAGGAGEVHAELRQKGRCNGAGEDGREDVQARRGGRSSRGSGAARRAEQERFRGDASGAGEFMGGGAGEVHGRCPCRRTAILAVLDGG